MMIDDTRGAFDDEPGPLAAQSAAPMLATRRRARARHAESRRATFTSNARGLLIFRPCRLFPHYRGDLLLSPQRGAAAALTPR